MRLPVEGWDNGAGHGDNVVREAVIRVERRGEGEQERGGETRSNTDDGSSAGVRTTVSICYQRLRRVRMMKREIKEIICE